MKTFVVANAALAVLLLLAPAVAAGDEDLDGLLASWVADETPAEAATPTGGEAAASDPANSWNFEFTLWLWLPSLEIETIVQGEEIEMEQTSDTSGNG